MFDVSSLPALFGEALVFGVNVGEIILAFFIFAIFYFLRGLAGRFLLNIFSRAVQRTETKIDDALVEALFPPVRFLFVVAGLFFAMQVLSLAQGAEDAANNLLRSLLVYAVFWFLYNSVDVLKLAFGSLEQAVSGEVMSWGVRALRWIVVALGAAAILEIWGVQIGALIAGLGLFGLAAALAAQDLFKNFLGGLSILIERRFKQGDWVKVEGVVEGTVEHVGFRSSKIIRFDKAPVVVPNSVFSDKAVINFSEMSHRRIYWLIGLEYRTSIAQLKAIRDKIEAWVEGNEHFAAPPDVLRMVYIDSFSDSSIHLMLYCFTKTTDWEEWLDIKQQLVLAIKEIVEGEGAGFAFPSRSLYVEALPGGGKPEIFVPPQETQSSGGNHESASLSQN